MTERDPIELTDDLSPSELAALSRLLDDERVWEEPDPRLEDAVVAAITAEAGTIGRPPTDEVELIADVEVIADPRPRRPVRGRVPVPRSSGGWGLLAGAAVAAALIVLVVTVASVRRQPEPPEGQVAMHPTADAPADARAEVKVEDRPDGTRIDVKIEGLPPAPPDEYYELWMKEEGDSEAVSAGTFHLRGGGGRWIELWSGVSAEEYPILTVTIEHEGEGSGASGQVLLEGRIG